MDSYKVTTTFEPFTTLYQEGDRLAHPMNGTVAASLIGLRNDKTILRQVTKVPDAAEMIEKINADIEFVNRELLINETEKTALMNRRVALEGRRIFHQARLDQQKNSITIPS